jgi:uncharacterized Zn-binding protein involved in type VI secretion
MTFPASRVGDPHICPQAAPNPHGGGAVKAPGSPDVKAGGEPSARHADMTPCAAGPPNSISIGAPGVIINKLLAARLNDATAHGGALSLGAATVLIGQGPPGTTMVRRGNTFIVVYRQSHIIMMVGVQEYSGTGASQSYADRSTQIINDTWSGTTTFEGETYKVEAKITGRARGDSDPANPNATQIDVVKTSDPPGKLSQDDPAYQPGYGRDPGHQHSTENDDGSLTVAHEFGHSMGLEDEYAEGPRNPDGTRSVTRTGPPHGIMGNIERGSRPSAENYHSLITGKGLGP